MNFSINFTGELVGDNHEKCQIGEIKIAKFYETFCPLSYWSKDQYLEQWKNGLRRLCNRNHKSCLITSMYNPKFANFIVWWTFYLDGNTICVQNQILFLEQLDEPFNELNPYASIDDRKL